MQNGPVLRDIDFFTVEHRVNFIPQAGFGGQLEQQFEGLVSDAVLRIIQKEARRRSRQTLAAFRIVGEKLPKMDVSDLLVVCTEGLPSRSLGERFDADGGAHNFLLIRMPDQAACLSAALLEAITASNSFQDFTNDLAPSS